MVNNFPIYWQSCIGCLNHQQVAHFLDHYVNVHGLDPRHARIVVHSDDASVQYRPKILRDLADRGFHPPHLWHGDDFTVHTKLNHLSAATGDVPVNAWLLLADTDEFLDKDFDIPAACGEADNMGAVYIRARMIDRLGPEQTMPELHSEPSLFEQYPEISNLTARIGRGFTIKVILRKAWVGLSNGGGHRVCPESLPVYHEFPALHHFKWEASVVPRLRERAKDFAAKGLVWWEESHRLANYLSGEQLPPPPFSLSPEEQEKLIQTRKLEEEKARLSQEKARLRQKKKQDCRQQIHELLEKMTNSARQAESLLEEVRNNIIARLMIRSSTLRAISSHIKKSIQRYNVDDFSGSATHLDCAVKAVAEQIEAFHNPLTRGICIRSSHMRVLAKIKIEYEKQKLSLLRKLEKFSRFPD